MSPFEMTSSLITKRHFKWTHLETRAFKCWNYEVSLEYKLYHAVGFVASQYKLRRGAWAEQSEKYILVLAQQVIQFTPIIVLHEILCNMLLSNTQLNNENEIFHRSPASSCQINIRVCDMNH